MEKREAPRPRRLSLEYIAGAHVVRFYNGSYARLLPDRVEFYNLAGQLLWTYTVDTVELLTLKIDDKAILPWYNIVNDFDDITDRIRGREP